MMSDSFISILLGIVVSTLINYCRQENLIVIFESTLKEFLGITIGENDVNTNQKTKILSNFVPIRSHRYLHMSETTLPSVFEELITEIKKTKIFTIIPNDPWLSNEHHIIIEFIKPTSSVQTVIKLSLEYYFEHPRIDELLSNIFQVSDTIQTWGDTNQRLLYQQIYRAFSHVQTNKVHIINIQHSFKTWYNTTFAHKENCGQILDFDDIDGPLCTCTYRPLKHFNDQWSLANAIAYTFHEKLDMKQNNIQEILALSKLSCIIDENWSRQQIEDYISEHHAHEKV
ncbi:unnamed protein product [Rotaria sp. Silwood1]|nr:unnamed protein product [Rotaria sp. Silwood1]CAF1612087.1 unnamed protein product [Rotaria sp. Silwood1]CAF3713756.1 unnamed protein product [Rotaria sp. Silwood1]CAF3716656.1 unnamed protein product [Rotaria sp. Silwood1]CAF3730619.1 unnamed protein product [Rotaria sp. Silwood1]